MGGLAALGGAIIGNRGAKKAAQAQERVAREDMNLQRETRDLIRSDLAPFRTGGYTAQQALDFELGLGARPVIGGTPAAIETITVPASGRGATSPMNALMGGMLGIPQSRMPQSAGSTQYRVNGQTFRTLQEAQAFANANPTGGQEYGGFTKTPGYDFRLNQGQDAIEASAAARGGLYSGAAMRDALTFGQDYASSEYNNFLNRLAGRADTGMAAAGMSGQASQTAAGNMSNALGNIGNAQAAGAIGQANAWTGGLQNLAGLWNYQRNLNPAAGGGGINTGANNWANPLFGGPGLGNLF
jgi:hypothetical protein